MNFSVLVACLTGLCCPPFDFFAVPFTNENTDQFPIRRNTLMCKIEYFTALSNCFIVMRVYFCSSQVLCSKSKSRAIG